MIGDDGLHGSFRRNRCGLEGVKRAPHDVIASTRRPPIALKCWGRIVHFVLQPYICCVAAFQRGLLPMHTLFDPIQLGAVAAPNRALMAPLTRGRATREHVPTDMMRTYYAQRAGAGLILTEATGISRQGLGWPYAPGIWSGEQVEGWKPVTEAVHEAGGRIFCQLWHMGRLVHPSFLDGGQPVSASATTAPHKAHTYEGRLPYAAARALRVDEIAGVVEDYAAAAHNALSGRLRRRPDPCRQRLSDRPVLARRHQSSRRRIWRHGRESPPSIARNRRSGGGGGGARPHSGAPLAQR
jgi:hypothetical protein